MPIVLLVRHGQASAQGPDYDVLSDLGREQARLVGAELRRRPLRDPVFVTGSLARQRDTATEAVGSTPAVDPRWDEYDHLRLLREHAVKVQGAGFQVQLDHALRGWIAADEPDGWSAFRHAGRQALAGLVARLRPGQDGVAFTSGGVIAAIAAGLVGGGADTVVALNRVVLNAGITKLGIGAAGPSLITWNDHAHLEVDRRLITYR